MNGRSRMTIDSRIHTTPGRSTFGFHRPGKHCSHQARSAVRCSAERGGGGANNILTRNQQSELLKSIDVFSYCSCDEQLTQFTYVVTLINAYLLITESTCKWIVIAGNITSSPPGSKNFHHTMQIHVHLRQYHIMTWCIPGSK